MWELYEGGLGINEVIKMNGCEHKVLTWVEIQTCVHVYLSLMSTWKLHFRGPETLKIDQ